MRCSRKPSDEALRSLVAALPGMPGDIHHAPDDVWDAFEPASEEPGRIEAVVWDDWAVLYQNVGMPMSPDEEDIPAWRAAFREKAAELGLLEVVSLFGSTFDWEPDAWTAWSLERGQPSRISDRANSRWSSPYDADVD